MIVREGEPAINGSKVTLMSLVTIGDDSESHNKTQSPDTVEES